VEALLVKFEWGVCVEVIINAITGTCPPSFRPPVEGAISKGFDHFQSAKKHQRWWEVAGSAQKRAFESQVSTSQK
jgi:hypothetical protein